MKKKRRNVAVVGVVRVVAGLPLEQLKLLISFAKKI